MPAYKVLVVDDSAFMRKMISDMISEVPQFQVIATAKNGKDAVEKVKELNPDVVTMDVEMPEMNGLQAVKAIMEEHPVPIIMLSSLTEAGAKETIMALEFGAIDFIRKPSGSISLDVYKVSSLLAEKLKVAVGTKVRKIEAAPSRPLFRPAQPAMRPPGQVAKPEKPKAPDLPERSSSASHKFTQIVAIGTSTGGPRALQQVLSGIPEQFPAPILIVQHMPPNFTKSLAHRLDTLSPIHVVEAEDGTVVHSGTAYIAPGGYHMSLLHESTGSYRIRLTKDEPRNGHRPSVEVLFESLLPFKELTRHVVIMTGMGSDGARAMQTLKAAGVESTIAESEETCVVYGMPRAAVELNCVKYVLPLPEISEKLIHLVET